MATKCRKANKIKGLEVSGRAHICMADHVQERLNVLCGRENRSRSNMLSVLVDREFERLGLKLEEKTKNGKGR